MGRAKGAKEGSLLASPARSYAALARPRLTRRLPNCGLRIHSATPQPLPAARPSPPGLNSADFLFFLSFCFVLFRFLPVGILCQEDSALSLSSCRSPLSAPLTSRRLVRAPALPGPCRVLPHAPVTSPGNNARERRGPKPAQVRTPRQPGLNARPLAAGLGGAVPGAYAAPQNSRTAPGRGSWRRRRGGSEARLPPSSAQHASGRGREHAAL